MNWGPPGWTSANHTHRHSNLTERPANEVRAELRQSKDQLGHAVTSFACPFGKDGRHLTDETRTVVRELGYDTAVAIRHHGVPDAADALELPRFTVLQDPVERLAAKIAGAWDPVGWGQRHTPLGLARTVSPDDFDLEPAST